MLLLHCCCRAGPGSSHQDRTEKAFGELGRLTLETGFSSGSLQALVTTLSNSQPLRGWWQREDTGALCSAGVHKRSVSKYPKQFIARGPLGTQHLLGGDCLAEADHP